ncbi:MAG: hypothetical protein M3Y42_04145 [Actinomycetota bacterium]|nr:hypothetical protein [Actinomycetota bacterium]
MTATNATNEADSTSEEGEAELSTDSMDSVDDVTSTDDTDNSGPIPAGSGRGPLWRLVALVVVTVVFAGLGTAFELRGHSLRSEASAKNRALADTSATSQVIGEVSTALNKVLSYQYANPSATQQAAAQLLTGDAAGQYQTLFTALQQKAPGEKLTLAAKVVVAGVTSLHGDTAQLLVFLDQSSTRASDKQSSTSAAQLDVTAVKQGGNWKISELLPL